MYGGSTVKWNNSSTAGRSRKPSLSVVASNGICESDEIPNTWEQECPTYNAFNEMGSWSDLYC